MACRNLTDFKAQIEDRFAFWDDLRRIMDSTRLDLKSRAESDLEWFVRYPEDKAVLRDLTMALHQCLIKTVEQYSSSLKALEELEESEMEEEQNRKGILTQHEETSKHTRNTELGGN